MQKRIILALLMLAPVQRTWAQKTPDWKKLQAETERHLQALIRINTVNPPGNEVQISSYLADIFKHEGIDYQIFEPTSGRANLVARLQSKRLNRPQPEALRRPLLLLAHADTVGVEKEHWSMDPFGGVRQDEFIWGRGAIDNKGLLAVNLGVFLTLKRLGIDLNRDIIFLASADEEAGGQWGIKWMMQNHWDQISSEYAINEGGFALLDAGKVTHLGIQCAEKTYHDVTLVAKGRSGHSAAPHADNAIAILAQVINKIVNRPYPVELNDITRLYFEQLGGNPQDFPLGSREYAMARNTVVPTMLDAGIRNNVIPSEATANLNIRLLPGTDLGQFAAELERVANEPRISFRFEPQPNAAATPHSSTTTTAYHALILAAQKIYPQAAVTAYMSPAATDSAQLRNRGVQAYGIGIPLSNGDAKRIHGHDERAGAAALGQALQFLWHSVLAIAQ